jgi:hypothetical protein
MDNRDALLKAALEYAGHYGWRIVPLHNIDPAGKCTCALSSCPKQSQGKHPRETGWHNKASSDEKVIEAWWQQWPVANIGIKLGPDSGIVDVEFDCDEGRKTADRLFGECFTPTYRSGRSVHRLLKWTDTLPRETKIERYGLEFRLGAAGKGLQSVVPPSQHSSGVKYAWLQGLSPRDVEPTEFPPYVLALLWNDPAGEALEETLARPQEHWDKILDGLLEGARHDGMASYIGKLLHHTVDLTSPTTIQVLYRSVEAVNERHQPPLPESELKTTFTSLLKKEQNNRLTEESDEMLARLPEQQLDKKPSGKWRLVIVHSDPPRYELHAPQFGKAEHGCLVLNAEQMTSFRKIRVQALKQAEYPLPTSLEKRWNAKGGLYELLILNAEHREAPPEEKRHLVVAERLLVQLAKAHELENGRQPDIRGRPCKLSGGEIVFGFTYVWEQLGSGADKVARQELSELLSKIGAEWHRAGDAKLKKLSVPAFRQLSQLLYGETNRKEPI